MPELPEVETVVRDLRPLLVGRTITAVQVGKQKLRRAWKKAWEKELTGAKVREIRRRGKWILVSLEEPNPPGPPSLARKGGGKQKPLPVLLAPPSLGGKGVGGLGLLRSTLLVHLGMTGQFTVAAATTPVADHTHFVFDLDNRTQLRFRDVRRFGSVEWFPAGTNVEDHLGEKLGPEPEDIDANAFRQAVRSSKRTLKAILLDQSVVAGVGNIYADESLFRAKLHPETRGEAVSPAACDRLRVAIQEVIAKAINSRGSTIRDYVGGSGLQGGFQHEFAVYGRTGEACPACEVPIEMVRVAGRSSHFCPRCQKRG